MSDSPGLRLVAITANRPGVVRLDGEKMPTITAAVAAARAGSVVEIGRGRYGPDTETYPLRIPDGVTLQGPIPPVVPDEAKKFLPTPPPAELDSTGTGLIIDGDGVTVAHLTLTNRHPGREPALAINGAADATVDSCAISGSIVIGTSRRATIRWTTVEHGTLRAYDVAGLTITGGSLTGTHGTDPLVAVHDSSAVRVEAAAITEGGVGVDVTGCTGVLVGACAVLADGDAVHVSSSRDVTVNGNRLRGGRAVHLVECVDGAVAANGIERADTAFELHGCAGIEIGANHIAEAGTAVVDTPD